MRADLAIVGMGLSGSRALIELIARLVRGPRPPRPLEILLFDRAGEFGRGVPYGGLSDRRALLIDDLRGTDCPQFVQWVRSNPAELEALEEGDEDDRAWFARNRQAIERRDLDGLYLPRHVFGRFSRRMLDEAIEEGTARGCIRVVRRSEEVVDLGRTADGGFLLETADSAAANAARVLLAVGSVPRHDPYRHQLGESGRDRYLCDSDFCGSFSLRQAFDRFQRVMPAGEVRIAIIGAAASAIESLYCALGHPALAGRIASVTTVSGSGMLPGGLRGPGDAPVSDYARLRSSAADYVDAARRLREQGRLSILAARLHAVRTHGDALRVEADRVTDGARLAVNAELVINCTGAGLVQTSPSRLLRNLSEKLALRRGGRGFGVRGDHSLVDWPNAYVAGPLLSGGTADTDVESIRAVFRVGRELGDTLVTAIETDAGAPGLARVVG